MINKHKTYKKEDVKSLLFLLKGITGNNYT